MIGSNIFQQVQQYQQQAGDIYGNMAAGGGAMTPYMNPYTQQVIERSEQDIARQREQALNQLGAQATRAGAFGGSRHGIAEGETYGQYGRMAGDMAAQQRQQAYQQGLQTAQNVASGYSGLGSQMFGQGMRGVGAQMVASELAQGEQQALLDAAYNQTLANLGYPGQALQTGVGVLGGLPSQTMNTAGRPGLLGVLGGIGGIF